jgi:hypothetical protein
MKLLDKALLIVFFTLFFLCGQTIQQTSKITIADVPPKLYKGTIIDGLKWKDKAGVHIIIITQLKKGHPFTKGFVSELYAQKYTMSKDSFIPDWKVQEFTPVNQAEVKYIDSTLLLFNNDNDTLPESRFFYVFKIDGLDPLQVKEVFQFRNRNLVIRGQIPIEIDPVKIDTSEYKKEMDKAFDSIPKNIRTVASKDWDDFIHKKFPVFKK